VHFRLVNQHDYTKLHPGGWTSVIAGHNASGSVNLTITIRIGSCHKTNFANFFKEKETRSPSPTVGRLCALDYAAGLA
jgi:hypothetical protein